MCNLYKMRATADEIARLFRATNRAGNIPALDGIYPGHRAPVVREAQEGREIVDMAWGFPPPPGVGNRPVTNVRNLESAFWRSALADPMRRCIVPVTGFCEWAGSKGSKHKVWFRLDDAPLFAFAGIWRPVAGEADRFAFLTTEPNDVVAAVHPKAMPVIIAEVAVDAWLQAPWTAARTLVGPYPSAAMRSSLEAS